jgi:hypothetical protein
MTMINAYFQRLHIPFRKRRESWLPVWKACRLTMLTMRYVQSFMCFVDGSILLRYVYY